MTEKNDYDIAIYNLLHPVLKEYSEKNKFGDNKSVPEEIRNGGFLKYYSKLLSNLLWKQKEKINFLDNLGNYSQITQGENIVITNDLTEISENNIVNYDEEKLSYFIYYSSVFEIEQEKYFNKSFLIYDGYDVFGIDDMVYDKDFTLNSDIHKYFYRLYVGQRKPFVRNNYLITKVSLAYYVAKNESVELNIFNSIRVNTSLLNNIYNLYSNKGSFENLKKVALSLEALLEIENFSLIPAIYTETVNKIKSIWTQRGYNVDDYFLKHYIYDDNGNIIDEYDLFKGWVYCLKFEDYKIDYLPAEETLVFVTSNSIDNLITNYNESNVRCKIKKDKFTYSGFNSISLTIQNNDNSIDKNIKEIAFKIGSDFSKWKLKIGDITYSLTAKTEYDAKTVLTFKGGVLPHIIPNYLTLFYEYWKYNPISISTKYISFSLKNEINSSKSKMEFDVYQYNLKMIKRFMPDNYVLKIKNIEHNGSRTLL